MVSGSLLITSNGLLLFVVAKFIWKTRLSQWEWVYAQPELHDVWPWQGCLSLPPGFLIGYCSTLIGSALLELYWTLLCGAICLSFVPCLWGADLLWFPPQLLPTLFHSDFEMVFINTILFGVNRTQIKTMYFTLPFLVWHLWQFMKVAVVRCLFG